MAFEEYKEYTLECDNCFDSLIDRDGHALHGEQLGLIVVAQQQGWLHDTSVGWSPAPMYCPQCRKYFEKVE